MGIYLPNMEMPTSCYKCPVRRRDGMDLVCPIAHERFSIADVNILEYRLDNCPLVPIPAHGRLIDAKRLLDTMFKLVDEETFRAFRQVVNDAPTVIEEEEGEA